MAAKPWETSNVAGNYLLGTVPSAVRIARVPTPSLRPNERWFPQIDRTFLDALAAFDTARKSIGPAAPAAVIATGPPFHMFAAAYYLSRSYNCQLVLDYRDEWTECPFDFVKPGGMDRWWERRCLRAADAVVFTTRSQLEHQISAFPALDAAKCVVIPNGWEPADQDPRHTDLADVQPGPNRIVIAFVGTLGSWAPPSQFLSALGELLAGRPDLQSRLKVRFVGRKSAASIEELKGFRYKNIIDLVDPVPTPTATRIMKASTALLVINPEQLARYIPGKLYEYIASRRPILVFGDGGETAALVRELNAGVVVPTGDNAGLERALDDLRRGSWDRGNGRVIDAWIAAHTRRRMAVEFFKLLDHGMVTRHDDDGKQDVAEAF